MSKQNKLSIALLNSILISIFLLLQFAIATPEIEKEIKLREQESKITEIAFISKEIESKINDQKLISRTDAENDNSNTDSNTESTAAPKNTMRINSNFAVTGEITGNKFYAEDAVLTGLTKIGTKLQSETITAKKVSAESIIIDKLLSKTGVLTIEADLVINNDISADSVNMRGTSFVLEGVRQWGLVHHDDFESEKSLDGWSDKRLSRCKNGKNSFLGGHCNLSYNEVSKVFKNLPKHEKLKVNAAYHMLDSWDGEFAYMKIDGEKVWYKQGVFNPEMGIDICGGDHNDPAFNIPVEVTVPHEKEEVVVTFGSTLDEEPCNESFGVDDVMIYVR